MITLRNEPLVRALVLTGAGGYFCARANLSGFKQLPSPPPEKVKEKEEDTYED